MRRRWIISVVLVHALAITAIGIRLWPRPPLAAAIPSSVAIVDSQGRLLRLPLAADDQYRLWTRLDHVAPEFVDALLLHEDRHYYRHIGINPVALARAAFSTYRGEARLGASTLTMQLARLMYGLNTRTVHGKVEQMARALWLELRYSKRELLEAHINLMPYGGNVQGVGAASLIYFGKRPADLSLDEALTLVVIPQSPSSRNPARDAEPRELVAARERLRARWLDCTANCDPGIVLKFGMPRTLPFEAPHLVDALIAHPADTPRIETTLNLRQQRLLERVLQNYVREHERVGIHNAAALLVDYRDMSVRSVIGSARFFEAAIAGQVNGTLAKRSPGSALKPFIYALAIDQGLIHPLTVLKDAPTSFGPFSPENFDGRFVGPITASAALVRSRNVPAVALSAQLAQPSLYQFLRAAGISRLASERHYGLALALGGGEVTMEEMVTLYAMLANHGTLRALRYAQHDPSTDGPRLLSEEASFMTLEMLEQNPRPDDTAVRSRGHVPVAWKTGTSWGFRDAWTVGVFGPYVLAVWIGDFDGASNPAFVGIEAAAPLFFRMVDALRAAEPDLATPVMRQPPNLARVEVCAASGDLPNADCPRTARTWFIPGRSPIRVSTVHRRVWIDSRNERQACAPYDPEFVRSEVFEFWPSDVLQLFAQAGMPRRQPPPAGDCAEQTLAGLAPRITSPLTAATYTLRAARATSETIPLAANADSDVRTLHWFVDDAYVGTGEPGVAIPWAPQHSGAFIVRAIDDRGRADSRELRVAVVR
jgi:penicillin-binding protein 1C